MAIEDKIKWNKKYQEKPSLLVARAHSKKLDMIFERLSKGYALDVACGTGRNCIAMAKKGFFVDAVDISHIALGHLNAHQIKNITTHLVDLDDYIPKQNGYDLIVMTNFLDRALIQRLPHALKLNGYILIETYMDDPINDKSASNPNYLLQKQELKSFFDESFEIVDYDEFENESFEMHTMKKQSIIVKKIK